MVDAITSLEIDYSGVDQGLTNLLRKMLTKDPEQRTTVIDLLFDEWLTQEGSIDLYGGANAKSDDDSFFHDSQIEEESYESDSVNIL